MSEENVAASAETVETPGGETKFDRLYRMVKADKQGSRVLQGRIAVLQSSIVEREKALDEEIELVKACHARTMVTADKALEEALAEIKTRRLASEVELLQSRADYTKLNKRVDKRAEELRESLNEFLRNQ